MPPIHRTDPELASYQEISAFLSEVERRAFKQAMFAVRDEHSAVDIVQDAMLKLTEKYSDKPAAELPMLFQRIVQNTIHDHFRRQKVRSTWTTLLSALGKGDEKDDDFDPLETLAAKSDSSAADDPARQLEQRQIIGVIEQALERLPARQREAFLLRYWEEFDVAETATVMGMLGTAGSVGGILFAQVLGFSIAAFGYSSAFVMAATLHPLSLLLLFLFLRPILKSSRASTASP